MRIAIVLDRFDPQHGGLEHWAFQLANWLVARGNEVHIVAAECNPRTADLPFIMHTVGASKSRVALAEKLERYLKELPVDVIHDLGSGWYYDVLQPQFGTKLADFRGNLRSLPWLKIPKYLCKAQNRSRLRDARELERRQYAQSNGQIIAVSQMTFADLRRFHRVSAERMAVIYNGVDPDQFPPKDSQDDRSSIRTELGIHDKVALLFPAHNFRLKGLETVLRAISRLRNPRLQLIVTGREPTEKWKRLATRLGIADQVRFCGFVPQIQPYYAAADVFVQPTFYDPCGLASLEAAACGLPVITSCCNGAAELFDHGKNGYIMRNPRDAKELAVLLQALMDNENRRLMATASRELALNNTTDRCFEEIFQIYMSLGDCRRQNHDRADCLNC